MPQTAERERASRRVGIFGGTFDPPHRGHLAVARDVADALALDQILWIPAGRSPHKPDVPLTAAPIRAAMVRATVADDRRFTMSTVELDRDGPSYTVDTVRLLSDDPLNEGTDFFLIVGVDQYRAFDAWRCPEEILEHAVLVVMDREGEGVARGEIEVGAAHPERIHGVPVRRVDISSTDVRARVGRGADISSLVTPAVATIIAAERLYLT